MKELIRDVKILAGEEATRSMIKHPFFNSTHEGYAVIKEEIEETEEELKFVNIQLNIVWAYIKGNRNENVRVHMKSLKTSAINLAAEAIQVAAMAQKFIDSFKEVEE